MFKVSVKPNNLGTLKQRNGNFVKGGSALNGISIVIAPAPSNIFGDDYLQELFLMLLPC